MRHLPFYFGKNNFYKFIHFRRLLIFEKKNITTIVIKDKNMLHILRIRHETIDVLVFSTSKL